MHELEKLMKQYNDSKIDHFINKAILKDAITVNLKKKGVLSSNHDSGKISFLDEFMKYVNKEPKINTITDEYEFNIRFKEYYHVLSNRYFQNNNIIIRGIFVINNCVEINCRNYCNFYSEIKNYYGSAFNLEDIVIKSTSDVDERPDSCIPEFTFNNIKKPTKRSLSASILKHLGYGSISVT